MITNILCTVFMVLLGVGAVLAPKIHENMLLKNYYDRKDNK